MLALAAPRDGIADRRGDAAADIPLILSDLEQ
jgi:hypothetical protein